MVWTSPALIEGGDGGLGCTMTMYREGRCGTAVSSILDFSWGRCELPLALFAVGVVLAVAGVYVGNIMSNARIASYLTGGSWDIELAALVTGASNPWHELQLIWDIGSYFVFDVLIPGMSWWQQLLAGAEEVVDWTPPGLAVHLTLAIISVGTGIAGLAAEGCIP